jgi:hypothetical protein
VGPIVALFHDPFPSQLCAPLCIAFSLSIGSAKLQDVFEEKKVVCIMLIVMQSQQHLLGGLRGQPNHQSANPCCDRSKRVLQQEFKGRFVKNTLISMMSGWEGGDGTQNKNLHER